MNETQARYEELLKNGKSSEEMLIIKEKLDKVQTDYQKSREKIEYLTIQLNTSESNLSKYELEYEAKVKRLEEKLSDSQGLKLETEKTYKEQVSNLTTELNSFKSNSSDQGKKLKEDVDALKSDLKKKEES